ncbi:hypothetical protein [Streptomyces iconiensis]|uniref:DUF2637 domain-containing protein n=1 Tax=Streptomyces iconiensis TaxID=1384038 RepID=A0ABT7AB32_9ACTN|nr:hypothetical protein [Streptomyces iconiensis]MDJ1138540.1 hypothetical protein [Streptomyces iconiensis]
MSIQIPAPPAAPSRREERRQDRAAEAAQRREDLRAAREEERTDRREAARLHTEQHTADRQARLEAREKARKARTKRRSERRKARTRRLTAARAAVSAHMPLPGIPVVVVSLVMGWTGQMDAAVAAGMEAASVGVPVLTEGMTLTLAGLTAAAISHKRPHRRLYAATWVSALVAAAVNAAGHLLQDASAAGLYRAGAFAAASLAALILWGTVMRSRRAALSGKSAAQLARWRRIRRRHPWLSARARHHADATGAEFAEAFALVWERRHGAPPGQPTVREIRATRRAQHRRKQAADWDGTRRRRTRTRSLPSRTGWKVRWRTQGRTDGAASGAYAQANTRTVTPKPGPVQRVAAQRRTGVHGTRAQAYTDAEMERTRQRAETTYAESLDAGAPLGPAALGREFGFSEGWGRKRIKAVETRLADSPPARLSAVG